MMQLIAIIYPFDLVFTFENFSLISPNSIQINDFDAFSHLLHIKMSKPIIKRKTKYIQTIKSNQIPPLSPI